MRFINTFFIALSFLTSAFGQNQSDYGIYLKSGRYESEVNSIEKNLAPGEIIDGKYYRLVQFERIPLQSEKEQMENAGVVFMDYIPNYAYIVSLPASADVRALFSPVPVRALMYIPVSFRMHPMVINGNLPQHALLPSGMVRVNLVCFDQTSAQHTLANAGRRGSDLEVSPFSEKVITLTTRMADLPALAVLPGVQWIEPCEPPAEPENLPGRTNHRSNAIATSYASGRQYDGSGVVVAMGDDGVIGPHIDYHGRTDQSNVFLNNGNHGDHVAGTIMGAGNLNPTTRGMAYGASLYVYNVWNAINQSPNSYLSDSVRITSTSYSNGCNAGYTTFAQTVDQQIRQNPSLMHVFSAGNDGGSDCSYGAGSGWGNVTGGVKVGKNVLTVANVSNNDVLAGSSSRGPVHDGRIKPDVAAVGTSVNSTVDVHSYAIFSGTSMACPGTSGTMAQLYQAYKSLNSGTEPKSGLIKSVMMNTAEDIGNPGPDFKHGYGRINALRAAEVLENNQYLTASISQGGTNTHTIQVPTGTAELKIMLYWNDYEGSVATSKALVNDLNMLVTDPSAVSWQPWVLDHTPSASNLNANAVRMGDTLNNAEQVTLSSPAAGTYTISVNGATVPQGPQEYFISWQLEDDSVTLTYPIGGESFKPGETELIRWDASGSNGSFNLEYSTNNGATWNSISNTVAASVRAWSWSVPSTLTGQALIRITRNGISDVSHQNFSIMNIPTNLSVDWACPDSMKISWTAAASATLYEVSLLGSKYMDSVAVTTATSIVLYNMNPFQEVWFSVKAHGPLNAVGRRANATQKLPGLVNCTVPVDAAVNDLLSPSGFLQSCHSSTPVAVTIEVENTGTTSISNIPVSYNINSGIPITETIATTLAPGASTVYTFSTSATFPAPGYWTVKTWSSLTGDGNGYNDTTIFVFQVLNSNSVSAPWTEDFENFSLCSTSSDCEGVPCPMTNGWINIQNLEGDDIDWRTDQGGTPTGNTGPSIDHAPGTSAGNYLYLEASGCFSKEAQLLTPCFDLTSAVTPELRFWYHMYGSNMGTLHVDVLSNGIWTNDVMTPISQNQGNQWSQAVVNLGAFNGNKITVRFRGVTGNSFLSDMALDNVQLIDNAIVSASFAHTNPVCVNTPVVFTDQSTGTGLTYNWNFGPAASIPTASTSGPHTVTFNQPGLQSITLIVQGTTGTDTTVYSLQVDAPPVPGFTWNFTGTTGTIQFTDTSSGAASYKWYFGDGDSSNWINPTHAFQGAGPYTIMQVLYNDCGTDTAYAVIDFTGIEHYDQTVVYSIYPNPAGGDQVYVYFRDNQGPVDIQVMDLTGRMLGKTTGNANGGGTIAVDVSQLSAGIYQFRISGAGWQQASRVVIY